MAELFFVNFKAQKILSLKVSHKYRDIYKHQEVLFNSPPPRSDSIPIRPQTGEQLSKLQESDLLRSFAFDGQTGRLTPAHALRLPSPGCVVDVTRRARPRRALPRRRCRLASAVCFAGCPPPRHPLHPSNYTIYIIDELIYRLMYSCDFSVGQRRFTQGKTLKLYLEGKVTKSK